MHKKLVILTPCVLLAACSETPDRYRDIKHLEMPPTLAIERNTSAPVKSRGSTSSSASLNSSSSSSGSSNSSKPISSDLEKLVYITGTDELPTLNLKTRYERAWDLISHALVLAELEVVDMNHDEGKIKLRYVDTQNSKGRDFVSSVTSFLSDRFEDTDYLITLDKENRVTGVHIKKANPDSVSEDGRETYNRNDAKSLAELLSKTIKDDLGK